MSRRIEIRLHHTQRSRLERSRKGSNDARLCYRIQVVLLYGDGWGSGKISEALGGAPSNIARIGRAFVEFGEASFEDGRKENGTPKVDDDLLQALAEILEESPEDYGYPRPTWTRELLRSVLGLKTLIAVSVSTIGRMLKMIEARWGMPRPGLVCPWSKHKKTRRINELHKVIDNLPPGEVAYYEDEVDIHLNPKIGRDWMLKGQQKEVITPGKNFKNYVAGASNIDGNGLVWVSWHRKNSDLFITLLEAMIDANPTATCIHLILDNYIIHDSKKVQAFIKKQNGLIELHFLPPYSPKFNKIEGLWKELHANVTRNHRCKTIDELMKKVHNFLRKQTQNGKLPARTAA